jgi:hypothetical protein
MALGRAEYLRRLALKLMKRGETRLVSAVLEEIRSMRTGGKPPKWDLDRLFQLLLDVEFAMERRRLSKGQACRDIAEREGVKESHVAKLHTKAEKHFGRQFSRFKADYFADLEREHSDKTLPE